MAGDKKFQKRKRTIKFFTNNVGKTIWNTTLQSSVTILNWDAAENLFYQQESGIYFSDYNPNKS